MLVISHFADCREFEILNVELSGCVTLKSPRPNPCRGREGTLPRQASSRLPQLAASQLTGLTWGFSNAGPAHRQLPLSRDLQVKASRLAFRSACTYVRFQDRSARRTRSRPPVRSCKGAPRPLVLLHPLDLYRYVGYLLTQRDLLSGCRQLCWLRWTASSLQVPLYHFTPPESYRPRGIVHFLGGAFAGATPQLLYPGLICQLSKAGYAVISTPYAVTFRHLDCAQRVQQVCRCPASCIAQHAVQRNGVIP